MISLRAVNPCHDLSGLVYDAFLNLVSPERKQKAARFLRREDACRSVVGEVLARYCIGQREEASFYSIPFKQSDAGKPYIDSPGNSQFSISHSGSWALCAVDNHPVGVDVERIHAIDKNISQRFFNPEEHAEIAMLPTDLQQARFFDYWTLKESYIKAIGKGLSCPLNSFAICFNNDRIGIKAEKGLPPMFFKQYNLSPEYKCALCASHEDFPKEIEIFTPEKLLEAIEELSI